MLFYIGHHLGEDPTNPAEVNSFIMFEVTQFDNYSYLFNKPTYINLDPTWTPGGFNIQGLRIGINGKEAVAGQAFASLERQYRRPATIRHSARNFHRSAPSSRSRKVRPATSSS